MKKILLFTLLCVAPLSSTGCDAAVIEVGKCAADDQVLSVALKDRERAIKYIDALIEANEKGERIDDTLSLLRKIRTCVEPLKKKD